MNHDRGGKALGAMPTGQDREGRASSRWSGSAGELVPGIRSGDPEAVRLVRDRVRKILSFKRLRVPDDRLDDLEQEIVTQVWQAVNRPGFDPDAGFWGFLELVTARRCIDLLRTRREGAPLSESLRDPRQGPLRGTLDEERARQVRKALGSLGISCRRLITLRLEEGLSYRELAERLGKNEGALRVQMHRCVEKARDLCSGLLEG